MCLPSEAIPAHQYWAVVRAAVATGPLDAPIPPVDAPSVSPGESGVYQSSASH